MVYFLLQKTWKEYYLNFSSALIKMVWNMKCWNIHRKDKYLVLLLIISNIFNLISDTMSYSKPEQMNDQEFYISVLQVKCLSKFRHLNGSNQSHVQKRVRIKKFLNWQEKTSILPKSRTIFVRSNLSFDIWFGFYGISQIFWDLLSCFNIPIWQLTKDNS